jgi:ATP-dependent DNA helicase DinG
MLAENLKEASKKALRALDRMQGAIGEALKDGEIRRKEAEPLLAESGFICSGSRASAPCGRC